MYVPLAAVIMAAVAGVRSATEHLRMRRGWSARSLQWTNGTVLIVALIVFSGLTVRRNADYGSAETMWRDVIRKRPDNFRQRVALTTALMEQGRFDSAGKEAKALLDTVQAAMETERQGETTVRAENARYFLPVAHNQIGRIFLGEGKTNEAVRQFLLALDARPGYRVARYNLAVTEGMTGAVDLALAECETLIRDHPKYGRAQALAARLLAQKGASRAAAERYEAAMALLSLDIGGQCEYAWLLATCPDSIVRNGQKAVSLAAEVNRATGQQSGRALDVLGAAYAESGDYERAVTSGMKALKMLQSGDLSPIASAGSGEETTGSPEDGAPAAKDIEARIRLYREGKPYHASGL